MITHDDYMCLHCLDYSFIHSFYFTEHKLHENNMKNIRTKSVP